MGPLFAQLVRRHPAALSALVYVAATAVMGRAVLAGLTTHLANDVGDPALNAAILAWSAQHVPGTDAWFQFPIFYPVKDALTLSEHLLGVSVIASPVYWLTGSAVAAYNITTLLTYPLCGLAMYALVFRLTRNAPAALLSGLAYAFTPYRVVQLAHIQMLAVFWAPLALLGLHAYLETRRRRWLALFAAAWALQGAANGYMLVFFSVLVGLWVLWFVVTQRRWRELAAVGAATALAGVPLLPILLRFMSVHDRHGFERPREETAFYSADVTSVACPDPDSPVWGWFQRVCRAEASGEQYLFVGVALVLLCTAGAWLSRGRGGAPAPPPASRALTLLSRTAAVAAITLFLVSLSVAAWGSWRFAVGPLRVSSSTTIRPFGLAVMLAVLGWLSSRWVRSLPRHASVVGFYWAAAVVMLAMSWGPSPAILGQPALETGPFAWLMLVPGMTALRAPARFFMLTTLCLSVVMGVMLARPFGRWRPRAVAVFVILGGMGLVADGWQTMPAAPLPGGALVPDRIRGGVALTLPMGLAGLDAPAELEGVSGGWRTINGYSGFEPQHYFSLRETLSQRNPALLGSLRALTDLHVIVPEGEVAFIDFVEDSPGAQLIGSANGRRQYFVPRSGVQRALVPAGVRHPIQRLDAACNAHMAALTVDGDPDTRWHCGAPVEGQEITADLGSPRAVGAVVPGIGPFWRDYPRQLLIETSIDGLQWETAWTGDVNAEAFAAALRDPKAPRLVFAFPAKPARFVRLRSLSPHDSWYWSIAELEVWSGLAEPAP